ncbi:MAG: hypothetical protein HY423_05560 [Candidatus Lambdaproteobacteria bacterium]|nr:hypothetical protein [Candidatus Lambdaproteobacteria bacterium]
MAEPRQSKSAPGCKVIVIRRVGATIEFGLRRATLDEGLPVLPMPDLLAIDQALLAFGREALALRDPDVHGRFVERPAAGRWLFYLLEERAPHPQPRADTGAERVLEWRDFAGVLPRLPPEDRKAVALAIRYLAAR